MNEDSFYQQFPERVISAAQIENKLKKRLQNLNIRVEEEPFGGYKIHAVVYFNDEHHVINMMTYADALLTENDDNGFIDYYVDRLVIAMGRLILKRKVRQ